MTGEVTEPMKHCVMVAAPHTSNWDFPFAMSTFWLMDVPVRFFIKDSYTKSIFGWFFKSLGAIGVNRENAQNGLTEFAVEQLKKHKQLVILVPAEGTRKRVEKWRTGFYHIAQQAQVPIGLGYLDFAKKEAGVKSLFYPTGNLENDLSEIQEVYKNIQGKIPENYNPIIH